MLTIMILLELDGLNYEMMLKSLVYLSRRNLCTRRWQQPFYGKRWYGRCRKYWLGIQYCKCNLKAGIRYTGRFDGDPLGQMTVAETEIIQGSGVQTFTNRFGDYSHLTLDPNNFTFWHTAEYFSSNNNWRTQIASFTLSGGFTNDVGVNALIQPDNGILTNAETVEVTIRNFGAAHKQIFLWNCVLMAIWLPRETFTGTIASNATANLYFHPNSRFVNTLAKLILLK